MKEDNLKLVKMNDAYGKLFRSIRGTDYEGALCAPAKEAKWTTFTAMVGGKYSDAVDKKQNPFRFMMVGRAVNDWDEYREKPDMIMDEEIFVKSSMANLQNEEITLTGGHDRFEWIDTRNEDRPCNTARPGIDTGEITGGYALKTAQIWSYTKEIWDNLYGQKTQWKDRWFEKIVWSNLYKIASHDGGNPPAKLQNYQNDACKDLLMAEIELFKPTHIFLAVGREYWFDRFADIFIDVKKEGTNISRGEEKNKEYVEAIARYKYSDGTYAKVVVACRPEGRIKEEYVNEVVSKF